MSQSKKKNDYNTFTPQQIENLKQSVKNYVTFSRSTRRRHDDALIYVGAAAMVARFAHKNQTLKMGGHNYITHPAYVAAQLTDPYERQIALLHDVLEKSNITGQDLLDMGFATDVVADVELLTRHKDTPYLSYIENVGQSLRAGVVKIEDILHNTQPNRIVTYKDPPSESTMLKRECYPIALAYLQAIQEGAIQPGTAIMDFICDSDFLKTQNAEDLYVMRKIIHVLCTDPGRMKRFDERIREGVAIGELPHPHPPALIPYEKPVPQDTITGGPG